VQEAKEVRKEAMKAEKGSERRMEGMREVHRQDQE
jgi:hypothetical protein